MTEAFIIDAIRTPRARGNKRGSLNSVHPQELVAGLLRELPKRTALNLKEVDDVILGCVTQVGDQAACIARYAVMAAEWPIEVPGYTVNRFCGSGLQAVNDAASFIKAGAFDLVVAGGVESMSRVKMFSDLGSDEENPETMMSIGNPKIAEKYNLVPQGISADIIATKYNISREEIDRFAASSQIKAQNAIQNGYFKNSIIPVKRDDGVLVSEDEYPNPKWTFEFLSKMPAMFKGAGEKYFDKMALKTYPELGQIIHVHGGGNASGVVDGAGIVLLASEKAVKEKGLKPRAKIVSMAVSGEEPTIMLTGPVSASKKALNKANLTVADIDLWEINEAFAAVPLYVQKQLNIPLEKINVNGGSIALGHPLGGTGAILTGTAVDELERRKARYALITLCIGGGMGIATIIERV
ncbi:MAG: acetyl-CoA C-acetyltransferase [Leptospiraceae bacterium]|nr:acetyl-CoA C-acetyltransferase [Leptospiraceae bacterium]MCP5498943.1 acetyl-CoA C-acetyltransferase [Leptospiraceae bacterium]